MLDSKSLNPSLLKIVHRLESLCYYPVPPGQPIVIIKRFSAPRPATRGQRDAGPSVNVRWIFEESITPGARVPLRGMKAREKISQAKRASVLNFSSPCNGAYPPHVVGRATRWSLAAGSFIEVFWSKHHLFHPKKHPNHPKNTQVTQKSIQKHLKNTPKKAKIG